MMSLATQSNDSIKRECTGPFEPSVSGENSTAPVVVTANATNASIEPSADLPPSQALGGQVAGTKMDATGIDIKIEPLEDLKQAQEPQAPLETLNPLQPFQGSAWNKQLGTNVNAPAMNVKMESSNNVPLQQPPAAKQVRTNMQSNFAATGLPPGPAQNMPAAQPMNPLVKAQMAMATPIVPTMGTATQGMAPISQVTSQNVPKILGTSMSKTMPNIPATTSVGAAPGTVRSSNGGGGQLLQFPWKLHEMLHLAEKNGKTAIISWLPGGNGFKVHNKEKFCAEIMPGYFASQKYKTFQRSLNLWGFESVAKGPDRGACYHQYFVKGHPELCHNM